MKGTKIMKKVALLLVFAVALSAQIKAYAYTSWENSPSNFNNSQANFQNSTANFRNSPANYQNSIANPDRSSVIDANGNNFGYAVPKSNGSGVNIYSNDGSFRGYFNY